MSLDYKLTTFKRKGKKSDITLILSIRNDTIKNKIKWEKVFESMICKYQGKLNINGTSKSIHMELVENIDYEPNSYLDIYYEQKPKFYILVRTIKGSIISTLYKSIKKYLTDATE